MIGRVQLTALATIAVLGSTPVPAADARGVGATGPEPMDSARAAGSSAPTTIEVTLTQGTNMAAALSPDGSTLVLDLQGTIWTLPAAGGAARALTDPVGDAHEPTWSPDGTRVAFHAYWSGDYDIWVMEADGADLRQLTNGPFDDREPHWSPDGSRMAFSSDRGGTYDIWEVDVASGRTQRLTDGPENEYGPAYAPDGRRLAYAADGDEAGIWVRPAGAGASRRTVELEDGEAFGPSWSPDGSRISYARQTYGFSELFVVDADGTGGPGTRVSAEDEDVFPFRATWTSGGDLLYTGDGRIRSRPSGGGAARDVAFSATVSLDRPAYRKALRSFEPEGPRPVLGIVSPALSPDGSTVAFAALGDLWTMRIGEAPVRLTDDPWVEVDPMWSPDGGRLAFASDREGEVDIWVHDVRAGSARKVTEGGGGSPVWAPDGTEIAYNAGGGLRVLDVASGQSRSVRTGLNSPGRATWSPDGRSVAVSAHWRYSTRYREGINRPLLLPVDRVISEDAAAEEEETAAEAAGVVAEEEETAAEAAGAAVAAARRAADGDRDVGLSMAGDTDLPPLQLLQADERWLDFMQFGSIASRGTDGPVWSPNGRLVAYVASGVLWTIPVAPDGSPVGPPRRLNNELSAGPTWSGDSESMLYMTTDRLRRVWLGDGRIEDVPVPLTWERTVPSGRLVVHAGALFDGVDEALRADVDIVIDGHRIVRVADHDPSLHDGRVIDASNEVVAPGLIDMHSHFGLGSGEALGRQWLSYGVTSVRIPSADPYDMVEGRESQAIGRRLGPRIFGTSNSVDGSRVYYAGGAALTSAGQIELEMVRAGALRHDLIKTYVRLPDAVQRRVVEEAHALGIPVTSHELYPAVAFGADGVEHVRGTSRRGYSLKVTETYRSYQDVVSLLARSGMTITPTVGIYGSFALLAETDPTLLDDPRIPVFLPGVAQRARRGGDLDVRRRMLSDMASLARRVLDAGGTVVVGTDSPADKGLTLMAEMQALVELGGMRPVDVMRGTTSIAAEAMGYGAELGTVRAGMLADLIVLGADPLEDIRAVRDLRTVIKDGRVYTLEELLERPTVE